MAKVKTDSVNPREKYAIIGNFFDIVSNISSKKEAIDFLLGALTPSEVLMVARRIQTAELILEDKSYEDIRKELGVGYQNILNANRLLNRESDGYKKQIERNLKRKQREFKKGVSIGKFSLLSRYPQHRFWKELLK